MLATGARAEEGPSERILFIPRVGDTLNLIFPGNPGGGGFNGPIYKLNVEKSVGSFTSDILTPGESIFAVLGAIASGVPLVKVDMVRGSFETRRGIIEDQHSPTLVNTAEMSTTPGYDRVVVIFAEGIVTGGTRGFHDATGTSSLYLKIEVNDSGMLPAIVQAGAFLFTLD